MNGQLEFVGDKVLIPANQVFCTVLQPGGFVAFAHCDEEKADDAKGTFDALNDSFDALGNVESVEVMTSAEWRKRYGANAN
jgi:hypothetical protein